MRHEDWAAFLTSLGRETGRVWQQAELLPDRIHQLAVDAGLEAVWHTLPDAADEDLYATIMRHPAASPALEYWRGGRVGWAVPDWCWRSGLGPVMFSGVPSLNELQGPEPSDTAFDGGDCLLFAGPVVVIRHHEDSLAVIDLRLLAS